ncbi:hypothetical protein GCM10022289_34520 [Pedobacter jeongneungensis]|uniref:HEAT repeat domain-containing protein n=1 Tax=Pedobacter jeongneungensis TaxID=947309 RepID=A0ABP8BLD6_9SPHI
MKYLFLLLLIVLPYTKSSAQSVSDFEIEFKEIAQQHFPDKKVDSLYKKYNHILFWFNPNSQLAAGMKNMETANYPLSNFKQSNVYKENIDALLADTLNRKYSFGCFLACAANDTSKTDKITALLKRSDYKDFWLATILTYLHSKDFEPIIKCIIRHKDNDGTSYLIDDFLRMDKQRLNKFGMDSISSKDRVIQCLAIRTLAKTENSAQKEKVLKETVITTDTAMKGWAIAVLAHLHAKEMFPVVKPYLANKDLHQICLKAIASSTSFIDIQYLDSLIRSPKSDDALLHALLSSENDISLRKWFVLVKDEKLPDNYYIDLFGNSLFYDDRYFDQICEIIMKTPNEKQLYQLMDYFKNKKDERSINFLNKCLNHPVASVKEKAKYFLNKN